MLRRRASSTRAMCEGMGLQRNSSSRTPSWAGEDRWRFLRKGKAGSGLAWMPIRIMAVARSPSLRSRKSPRRGDKARLGADEDVENGEAPENDREEEEEEAELSEEAEAEEDKAEPKCEEEAASEEKESALRWAGEVVAVKGGEGAEEEEGEGEEKAGCSICWCCWAACRWKKDAGGMARCTEEEGQGPDR